MFTIIDDKQYLSSADAAREFGYVPDYITMLARQGLITAKRYGRAWYVDPDSLRVFQSQQELLKDTRAQELSQARRAEYVHHNGTQVQEQVRTTDVPQTIIHPAASIATPFTPRTAPSRTTFAVRPPSRSGARTAQFAVVSSFVLLLFVSGAYAYQNISLSDARDAFARVGEMFTDANETVSSQQASAFNAILDTAEPVDSVEFLSRSFTNAGETLLTFTSGIFAMHERFIDESASSVFDILPALNSMPEDVAHSLVGATTLAFDAHELSVKGLGMLVSDARDSLKTGKFALLTINDTSRTFAAVSESGNWLDSIGAFFGKLLFAIFGGGKDDIAQAPAVAPRQSSEPLNPLTVPVTEPSVPSTPVQTPSRTIVERTTPQTVIENITRTITLSGVSEETLASKLQQLENALRQDITRITGVSSSGNNTYIVSPPASGGTQNQIILSQKIDQLSGVDISGGTITGASISGGSIDVGALSGAVTIAKGGTGTTTAPSQDQLLIGTGTDYDLKTLTAGSNITISTSSNAITISSTGGGSFGQGLETFATGYIAPTSTVAVVVGATTTASATNALFQVNATSTTGTLIHASTSPSFAGSIMKFVSSAGTQLLEVAANGALTLAQALGVTSGGTGWGNIQANALLFGNGTGALATTSAGTNGQTLALVGGVPTWVATTTLANISGTLAIAGGGTATTTFYNGGVLFYNSSLGTLSQASAQSGFFYDNTNSKLGVGTSTPWATLSVDAPAGVASFAIGSSTATHFVVDLNGLVGIGTTSPSKKLSVKNTVATAQFSLAYDDTRYANFQVDSVGDLVIDAQGGDISALDENLFICSGDACPTGTPAGTGNIIVETALGIGSSTPWANLSVAADAGEIPLSVGSTTSLFHIDQSGKVGVGTTTPSRLFTISASSSGTDLTANQTASLAIANLDSTDNNLSALEFVSNPIQSGQLSVFSKIVSIQTSHGSVNGDLAFVTSRFATLAERARITSTGFLGIASTSPWGLLSVNPNGITGPAFVVGSSTATNLIVTNGGKVGVGTTSPAEQFAVANNIFVGNGGVSTLGQATSTFQGDIRINGKLYVSTIDPVYQIAGVKYATYGHSTIGIKEETVQTVRLTEYDEKSGRYVYTVDFSALPRGSDLWLFYQVTDFGAQWQNLVVSLTPGFDGTAFYEKDVKNKRLVIKSTQSGEVSLRLIANRHDSEKWPNLQEDQDDPFTHFTLPGK